VSSGAAFSAMTAPAGRRVLPADRAAWHPAVRLGAFVAALVVGSVLAQAVAYPVIAAVLSAVGVRPLVSDWLTVLGAVVASALVVQWAEPVRATTAERIALTTAAWKPGPLLRGMWTGGWPIAAAVGLLLVSGVYEVQGGDRTSFATGTWRALSVLVPAALAEELVARGYAWTVLAEWRGPAAATAATSVAFAALHALNPGVTLLSLVCVLLAGVLLALVRWQTGSLAAAWLAHLAWNVVLVVLAHAPVSGLSFAAPAWRLVPRGPEWLTGGAYGPEGSLVTAMALAAAIVLLSRRLPHTGASPDPSSAPAGAMRTP
jgi:uncharacterized protein